MLTGKDLKTVFTRTGLCEQPGVVAAPWESPLAREIGPHFLIHELIVGIRPRFASPVIYSFERYCLSRDNEQIRCQLVKSLHNLLVSLQIVI